MFGASVDGFGLKQAVARVKPAVAKRGALPVLTGVLIEAFVEDSQSTSGEVVITASDLDLTLRTRIPADVVTAGRVIVPFSLLEKAVAPYTKTKTETTVFTADDGKGEDDDGEFAVTVDGSTLTFKTRPVGEWPHIAVGEFLSDPDEISLSVEAFVSVAPFASSDGARPILTGILVDEDGQYAATDSYRLAVVETDEERTGTFLVPASIAPLLAKHGSGRVTALIGRRSEHASAPHILIELDELTILQRCIEGTFPNYKGLVPSETPVSIDVDLKVLHAEVEKIRKHKSTLGTEAAPVRITNAFGRIVLSLTSQDVGSVERTVHANMSHEIDTVAFNPDYFASILNGASGTLAGTDVLKPWIIRWSDEIGTTTRLLMPVRTS